MHTVRNTKTGLEKSIGQLWCSHKTLFFWGGGGGGGGGGELELLGEPPPPPPLDRTLTTSSP